MKILLAAAQSSSSLSGLQRHAFNLVGALLQWPEISAVHLLIAPWQRDLVEQAHPESTERLEVHVAGMRPGPLDRNLWYHQHLPRLVAEVRPDIVHLSYPVPVRPSAFHCPVVLTLHDLYPYEIPGNFGFPKVLFNRAVLRHCLRNADAIACVSDSTLLRLRRYAPRSCWARAQRIYNCVEPRTDVEPEAFLHNWNGHPFLLTVSQHRSNKNIALLLRVFHRLLAERRIHPGMKLLVIGIPGPETDRLYRLVSELQLSERVLFVHGLSDPALQWCYRNAEALVAPSHTEGFGLPVIEALLAGCRVVCSDIPAFREIAAGQCRLVPLGFGAQAAFADAIVAELGNPPPPPASLPQFSSAAIGLQHLTLYRGLLDGIGCAATSAASFSELLTETTIPGAALRRDERC